MSYKLTAIKAARIRKPGRYSDGGGLYLQVRDNGKSWLLRYMLDGKARAMGLGPLDLVPLADARERAREARRKLLDAVDPIDARNEQRNQRRVQAARSVTFKQCGERYVAAHAGGWKNEKHAAQWTATLATYAYPVIGALPVAAIDTGLIMQIIEPIWHTKTETASRVRGRIESVLDWARTNKYRSGENPARWKGHLATLLPKRSAVAKVKHLAALPYNELPTFLVELRTHVGVSPRALEFMILTAVRTGEVIGATWNEIDIANKVWTIPDARMKAAKEHRVPLSKRVIEILNGLPCEKGNDYVFIGARAGKAISSMAMLELMKNIRPEYVPHGFRSTFRDWSAEKTDHQNHIVEAALAHAIGDKVEAAYRRGDLFDKRRRLMDDWSKYCD